MNGPPTIVEAKRPRVAWLGALGPPRPLARRGWRYGALGLGLAVTLWLGVSLALAHQLTKRQGPRRAEPVPALSWGRIEARRHTTRDGQQIGSWFIAGRDDAPSVLLLHGNGGRRANCLRRAAILSRSGCSVMLISLRGHGDSTGEFNDIGFSARHDVVAAVEFLERRRPGRPVVIHGTSMGAAAAVFASRELGRRVRGYILESPYQDLRTAVRNRTENALPPVFDWVAYQGLALVAPLVISYLDQIAPVKAIEGVPGDVPVLILAGGRDLLARPSEARALHRRVESHARLLLFEHAGHLDFPVTDPILYRRSILEFVRAVERSNLRR